MLILLLSQYYVPFVIFSYEKLLLAMRNWSVINYSYLAVLLVQIK